MPETIIPQYASHLVSPEYLDDGWVVYAEITPAWSRWLPWPGRTSRWWFEIMHAEPQGPAGKAGVEITTHGYEDYGSGGGFTLRACVLKATEAVQHAADVLRAGG